MGFLNWRKNKVAENAAEQLEPGESVRELAMTNRRANRKGQNVAVVATERHVYAFGVSNLGLTKIAEVIGKLPLADAELKQDRRGELVFGEHRFFVLIGAGKDAERLLSYVNGTGPSYQRPDQDSNLGPTP